MKRSPIKRLKIEAESPHKYASSSSDDYDEFDDIFISPLNKFHNPHQSICTVGDDENKIKNSDKSERRKDTFIGTPSKFGMKSWNENQSSLLEHLFSLQMSLSQAEVK